MSIALNKPYHWLLRHLTQFLGDGPFVANGDWTPRVYGVTSGEATHSTQDGNYHRLGPLVFCEFRIEFTKNTVTGAVEIDGLPFTSANQQARPGVAWGVIDEISSADTLLGYVEPNLTSIRLVEHPHAGGAFTTIVDGNLHASNTMELSGSFWYTAA